MDQLECYLVGGAVRDGLLGLPVKDRDWVVVGATQEEMNGLGFKAVGRDFPVFLHPQTQEEYALARTEKKNAQGHRGFVVNASPDVSLEDDLSRRDLTINAIAQDSSGSLIDPYAGQKDLRERKLRHVSPAFQEDPLRVFRVARFASKLAPLGFTIADETLELMRKMSDTEELTDLSAERVWQETENAMMLDQPSIYFQTLRECGALAIWFPEIDALFGVPQPPEHHPEIDTGLHTLLVLDQAAKLGGNSAVRWAALTHDLGKALTPEAYWPKHHSHEKSGLKPLASLHQRINPPKKHQKLAKSVTQFHLLCHTAFLLKAKTIVKLFEQLDLKRNPENLVNFTLACEADSRGRTGFEDRPYPQKAYLSKLAETYCNEPIDPILATGVKGGAIRSAWKQAALKSVRQAIRTMSQE